MSHLLDRLTHAPRRALQVAIAHRFGAQPCRTYGFRGRPQTRNVLWPELVEALEQTPEWAHLMNEREGNWCAL